EVVDVRADRVVTVLRSGALPEAHVIGHDHAPELRQARDEAPVQVAPGGLAVETHDRVTGAFVDEVHAEARAVVEVGAEGPGAVEGLVCRDHGPSLPNPRTRRRRARARPGCDRWPSDLRSTRARSAWPSVSRARRAWR